jgi:hypothetical protein
MSIFGWRSLGMCMLTTMFAMNDSVTESLGMINCLIHAALARRGGLIETPFNCAPRKLSYGSTSASTTTNGRAVKCP